ncbi:hypothetical protein [Streptomyces phaeochromogenes]|uniref:hypothetical protein n=1 Tax=Streptomyces phaeochromogenes TaxID=1923 RepID=UPI002DD8C48D|nr:hypothetical protein [Streptomyces phaeochromogenes]WRZ30179.1 hypothetical protein OG931_21735 [Streptomyces phaeochromogenes]
MQATRTRWLPAAQSVGWFQLSRHDDPEPVVPPADPPKDPATDPAKDPAKDPAADPAKDPADPDGANQLGDAGKKALDAMKAERAAAKREAAAEKKRAEELAAKVQEFEDRDKSEIEKAQANADRATARAEAATKRAVTAEVRAAAAEFADADDAIAFLDVASYANDAGEIDTEQIRTDLTSLLERKPHLRRQTAVEPPKGPRPDPSQGVRPSTQPADFRTASSDEVNAALAKYGISPRR